MNHFLLKWCLFWGHVNFRGDACHIHNTTFTTTNIIYLPFPFHMVTRLTLLLAFWQTENSNFIKLVNSFQTWRLFWVDSYKKLWWYTSPSLPKTSWTSVLGMFLRSTCLLTRCLEAKGSTQKTATCTLPPFPFESNKTPWWLLPFKFTPWFFPNPNDPCFEWKASLSEGLTVNRQNRGWTGSRYIYPKVARKIFQNLLEKAQLSVAKSTTRNNEGRHPGIREGSIDRGKWGYAPAN